MQVQLRQYGEWFNTEYQKTRNKNETQQCILQRHIQNNTELYKQLGREVNNMSYQN